MSRQINKEYSGSTTAREPDTATMKNVIYTVLAVILALLLISTQYSSNNQSNQDPVEVEHAYALEELVEPEPEPIKEEPAQPTWDELSTAEKIKLNPQGCDLNAQVMHEDGSCHDKPVPVVVQSAPAVSSNPSGGTCESWLAQAGIPLTNATKTLIIKESGCRTNARNPSSGACGIPQAYPCSKLPCPLNDSGAVCQLQWMDNYVKNRYGSWDNALSTWYSRCGSPQGCWY